MRKLAVLLLSYCALSAYANEESNTLQAEAEVGALATSGNTESAAFKGKLDIKHNLDRWRNNYILEGFYKENEVEIIDNGDARTENQVTAEKYFLSGQADYKLNEEHRGLFVYGSYEEDKFSGYDYQGTIAGGYSDRLFKTENTQLDYSIGPGLAYSKTEAYTDDNNVFMASTTDEVLVVRVAGAFLWDISENSKFTQTLSSDVAADSAKNTKTKAESAITATLNSSFALKAAYSIQNNSVVRSGIEKTDTQTSVTLVYTY